MKERERAELTESVTGGASCKLNTNHRGAYVELKSVAAMIEKINKKEKETELN